MKNKNKKLGAALMAGILCLALLSACSAGKEGPSSEPAEAQQGPAAESGQPASTYEFPALGLTARLSDALIQRMNTDVFMVNNAIVQEDGSALAYGVVSWYLMPEEQSEEDGFALEHMQCAGVLGVYQAGLAGQLDELTGCDEHQEVGRSADGEYVYYLSTNSKADPGLTGAIRRTEASITDMPVIQSGSDTPAAGFSGSSIGKFTTQDVNGNPYTQDLFSDYDLTLVNLFTTWCSPCVAEMPDLEKLYQQMKDRGVGVAGVVLDVLNEKGEIVQGDLERAQLLVERTGVTYPVLLPDSTYMNGRLTGIEAFPETFFVDRDGNIVGETYSGSGDLEYWLATVEKELANLKGEA